MDEQEVRHWLVEKLNVSRETLDRLARLATLVTEGQTRQNLISSATIADIWDRHIRDSAQLLALAPNGRRERWVDLGSGAGFPGLVLALIGDMPVTLVESRRLRQDFLRSAIDELGLADQAKLYHGRVESLTPKPYAVITARAFAPMPRLFDTTAHLADADTVWLLPKGENVEKELAETRLIWHGDFEMIPSATYARSYIVRAQKVMRKRR